MNYMPPSLPTTTGSYMGGVNQVAAENKRLDAMRRAREQGILFDLAKMGMQAAGTIGGVVVGGPLGAMAGGWGGGMAGDALKKSQLG
jgi:hypothetical protein